MGVSTPESPEGDSAISREGIVQGHAYAVLKSISYKGEHLIQLRNPHGRG